MLDEHLKASIVTYSCLSRHIGGLSQAAHPRSSPAHSSFTFPLQRLKDNPALGYASDLPQHLLSPEAMTDARLNDAGPLGEGLHHVAASQSNMWGAAVQPSGARRPTRASFVIPTPSQLTEAQAPPRTSIGDRFSEASSATGKGQEDDGNDYADSAKDGTVGDHSSPLLFTESQAGAAKEYAMVGTPYAPRKSFGGTMQGSTLRKIFITVLPPDHRYIAQFKVCPVIRLPRTPQPESCHAL